MRGRKRGVSGEGTAYAKAKKLRELDKFEARVTGQQGQQGKSNVRRPANQAGADHSTNAREPHASSELHVPRL